MENMRNDDEKVMGKLWRRMGASWEHHGNSWRHDEKIMGETG